MHRRIRACGDGCHGGGNVYLRKTSRLCLVPQAAMYARFNDWPHRRPSTRAYDGISSTKALPFHRRSRKLTALSCKVSIARRAARLRRLALQILVRSRRTPRAKRLKVW